MTQPEPIRTPRLQLPALSIAQYDELLADKRAEVGKELDADIGAAWLDDASWLIGMRREQLREHPEHQPWLIRPILRREDGAPPEAIGYVNFHAPPNEEGIAEIGYALLVPWRGRGYGLEAARGALGWAAADPRVRTLRASVAPDNQASLRLIAKLGFEQTGEQWDSDDGLEIVYDISTDAFRALTSLP